MIEKPISSRKLVIFVEYRLVIEDESSAEDFYNPKCQPIDDYFLLEDQIRPEFFLSKKSLIDDLVLMIILYQAATLQQRTIFC